MNFLLSDILGGPTFAPVLPEVAQNRLDQLSGKQFRISAAGRKLTFRIPSENRWFEPLVGIERRVLASFDEIVARYCRVFVHRTLGQPKRIHILTNIEDDSLRERTVAIVTFLSHDNWSPVADPVVQLLSEGELAGWLLNLKLQWDENRDHAYRVPSTQERAHPPDAAWIGPAAKGLRKHIESISDVHGVRLLFHNYQPDRKSAQVRELKRFSGGRAIRSVFTWSAYLPDLSVHLEAALPGVQTFPCLERNQESMLDLFSMFCQELSSRAVKPDDAMQRAISSADEEAYLAVLCERLYRRRKIGAKNHFEEEQVLWKIKGSHGNVPLAREVLISASEKLQDGREQSELILYKDGRKDGGKVFFLNAGQIGKVKQLCEKFDLELN